MADNKSTEPKNEGEVASNFEISENGPAKYRELMLKKQKLLMGIFGGVLGLIIGNLVWIGIFLLGQKIDFLLVGVGFLIGFSVKYFGKGIEPKFGIIAGIIALLSPLIGYVFIGCIIFSQKNSVSILSVISHLTPSTAFYLLSAVIGDFWGILSWIGAVVVAYYFSFKPIKEF